MAVIETEKEGRDVRSVIFIVALVVGFCALGVLIWWLVKPSGTRQVKLSGKDAEAAGETYVPPTPPMPAAPPMAQATDPGPTMLTLDLKQVTPQAALMEMAKQAKVNLSLGNQANGGNQGGVAGFFQQMMAQGGGGGGPLIDVSVKNEPFWPAFFKLCQQNNLHPYSEWNQPTRMQLRQGSSMSPKFPTIAVGSSMVVLESITSTFDADLTGPRPPSRQMNVNLQLYVEPKLSAYRISAVATLETAVDEKGNNLIRPRTMWDDRQGGGPQSAWQRDVNCMLTFPDNAGDRIKSLKGYCSVALAGPEKTVNIDQPLGKQNVDVNVDGTLLKLVSFRKRGSEYECRMAGDANSPVFKEYDRMRKLVRLIDDKDQPLEVYSTGYGGGRNNTVELYLGFHAAGGAKEPPPKQLQVTLPSGIKELRVPFEFSDLPLPH
jgi:hypothetical protein